MCKSTPVDSGDVSAARRHQGIGAASGALAVRLVPFSSAHFPLLISWCSTEAEALQWAGPTVTVPLDEHQLAAMLDESRSDPPARLCWMAEHNEVLVGHAQLGFDWRNGIARLSRVAVAPFARGRGLAKPMLTHVVDAALRDPQIERVELNVYPFNEPALRTYRALGFVQEGMRRASARVGAERWDTVHMGLLRSEWRAA
jgi:RimJ/RimL family protein N-acetyltransferase